MLYPLALSLMRGITQTQTVELLRHFEDISVLFLHTEDALADIQPKMQVHLRKVFEQNAPEALERAQKELEFCHQHHIRPISLCHEEYPQRLAECPDAPPIIFYRGTDCLNAKRMISVVGTRRISPYGKDLCQQFCTDLAQRMPEAVVVSGLAYGVDIHTHRACVEQQLPTIGVLAHGLDRLYPSAHRDIASQMIQNGGLLTEYITHTRPLAGNFVRRNRIVAGMTDATIVVESAHKGGALITAHLAGEYDRLVCAFPGRTHDAYSEGCNHLIRDRRAELITSAQDLLDLLGWATQAVNEPSVQLDLFSSLSPNQQLVVETLRPTDGLSTAQLCIKTNLDLSTINTLLFELEMTGVVTLLPGGRYRLLSR